MLFFSKRFVNNKKLKQNTLSRNVLFTIFLISGVTAIRPEDLELPGTMTDLDHDTWMLSG